MPEALAAYVAGRPGRPSGPRRSRRPPSHFERALEIWDLVDDAEARSELGVAAVVAHAARDALIAGDRTARSRSDAGPLELADDTGDVVAQALAHERLGGYLWAAGDSDAALAAHRDAVRVLPAEPPSARAGARARRRSDHPHAPRAWRGDRAHAPSTLVATARAVGERADEGRALNTFGAALTMMGDWAAASRRCARRWTSRGSSPRATTTTRAYVNLCVCLDKQGRLEEAARARARGRARGRARRRADPRRVPRRRRMLEAHTPGSPRRGRADRRAGGRGGAEGHGRGPGLRRRRASRHAPRPARRGRRAFRSARASSAAGRAIRTGSATRPAARPRSRSGAPIPRAARRIAAARWTSSPAASTSSPPCASTPPALRAVADCALRALALGDERRADEAQRDARATLERLRDPPRCGSLAARHAGTRAGRLRGGLRRRALAGRRGPRSRRLGRRGGALRGTWRCRSSSPTRAGARPRRSSSPAATATRRPNRPARGGGRSPRACARRCWRPRSRASPARRGCRRRGGRRRARTRPRATARPHQARARRPRACVAEGHTNREIGADALHLREDRERPRLADPGQARRALPGRGGHGRPPPRPRVRLRTHPARHPPGGDNRSCANTRLEPRVRRPYRGARAPRGGAGPSRGRHGGRRVRGRRVGRRQDAAAARARAPRGRARRARDARRLPGLRRRRAALRADRRRPARSRPRALAVGLRGAGRPGGATTSPGCCPS